MKLKKRKNDSIVNTRLHIFYVDTTPIATSEKWNKKEDLGAARPLRFFIHSRQEHKPRRVVFTVSIFANEGEKTPLFNTF